MNTTLYSCPKCKKVLVRDGMCAKCQDGHAFDFAREGYINLLVGKGGGTHGDNRAMLLARKNFLSFGYYQPMADATSTLLVKYAKAHTRLLDIGCGEGYYTERFAHALGEGEREICVYAFDISRDAVKLAAKRPYARSRKHMNFAVASAYHMPYVDGSFDLVSNLFSPLCPLEIARVLAKDGYFVMVIPGSEHLFGLKSAIYDTPYKNEVAPFDIEGFSLVQEQRLTYTVTLAGEEISTLFAMTPYAYRTSSVGRERVGKLSHLTTDVDFHILVYKKA